MGALSMNSPLLLKTVGFLLHKSKQVVTPPLRIFISRNQFSTNNVLNSCKAKDKLVLFPLKNQELSIFHQCKPTHGGAVQHNINRINK